MGCVCSKERSKTKKKSSKISYTPVKSEKTKIASPKTEGKYQKLDAHGDNGDREDNVLSKSMEDLQLGKEKKEGYSLLKAENEDLEEYSHHSDGDNGDENISNKEIHIEIEDNAPKEISESRDDDVNGSVTDDIEVTGPSSDEASDLNTSKLGDEDVEGSKYNDDDIRKEPDSSKFENTTSSINNDSGIDILITPGNIAENVTSNMTSTHEDVPIADKDHAIHTSDASIAVEQDVAETTHLEINEDEDEVGKINVSDDITNSVPKVDIDANVDEPNVIGNEDKPIDTNDTENDDIANSVYEVKNDEAPRIVENNDILHSIVDTDNTSHESGAETKEGRVVTPNNTNNSEFAHKDAKDIIVPHSETQVSPINTKGDDVTNVDVSNLANLDKDAVNMVKVKTECQTSNAQIDVNSCDSKVEKVNGDHISETSVEIGNHINAEIVSGTYNTEDIDERGEHEASLSQRNNETEITLEIKDLIDNNEENRETKLSHHPQVPLVEETCDNQQNGGETEVLSSLLTENPEIQNTNTESNLQLNNEPKEPPSTAVESNATGADADEPVEKNIPEDSVVENTQSSDNELDMNSDPKESLSSHSDNDENQIHDIGQNGNLDKTESFENNNESLIKDQSNGIDNYVEEKELTYEKAKSVINASLEFLKNCNDPASDESWIFMKRLAVASCIVSSIGNDSRRQLANFLVQTDFPQLFVHIARYLLGNVNVSNSHNRKEDNLKVMKGTCTNFSTGNEFEPLVCELARHGAVSLLFEELDTTFPPKTDHELLHVVHTLNILSNCVRCTNSQVRQTYRNGNAVNILMKYLKSNEIKLKMESLSILAYVMDDKEGDILGRTDGYIPCLIDVLQQAVAAEDYYVHYSIAGEPSGDGVYGLVDTMNRLVNNDSCKRKVVQCGGIPTVIEILQIQGPDADDSQLAALEILWKIAFIEKHQQILIQHILDSNVVPILTGMQSSSFPPSLRNASTGLLLKLGLVDIVPNINNRTDDGQATILMSYDVDNKKQATKLRDILVAAGFKLVMDEDKTDGNLFSSMVNAVGCCAAVLLCVSLKYKESIYCQTEATYAVELGKPIIPLRIEELYKTDGWLATLISTRRQFMAYSDDALEEDIEDLIEELVECGCI